MQGPPCAPEDHTDYRALRLLWVGSSRLVVACLFLAAWNFAFFRDRDTLIFLGSTTVLALAVSLVAGSGAYYLFKRRGGRVERGRRPAPQP